MVCGFMGLVNENIGEIFAALKGDILKKKIVLKSFGEQGLI